MSDEWRGRERKRGREGEGDVGRSTIVGCEEVARALSRDQQAERKRSSNGKTEIPQII